MRPACSAAAGGGGGGNSVELIVHGRRTIREIDDWLQPILAAAQNNPGFARPRLNYEPTSPRLLVDIDREKAAALGVSAQPVGRALETMFGSPQVTTYIKDGQEYDVILQTDRDNRAERRRPGRPLCPRPRPGDLVPLSSVVTTQTCAATRPTAARRPAARHHPQRPAQPRLHRGRGGQPSSRPRSPSSRGQATIKWGGTARDYLEAGGAVGLAFGMALLLVFLVLAAQFESWIHPAVIMLTVPVAALGGLFGLLIAGSTINTYSQIGLIILIGIAAKNGILIVEFANQLRDEGLSIREAVIESAVPAPAPDRHDLDLGRGAARCR